MAGGYYEEEGIIRDRKKWASIRNGLLVFSATGGEQNGHPYA